MVWCGRSGGDVTLVVVVVLWWFGSGVDSDVCGSVEVVVVWCDAGGVTVVL